MKILLSRNKVQNFDNWKKIFDEQLYVAKSFGLILIEMWTDDNDSNNIFFTFKVEDIEKAKEFLNDPKSVEIGKKAGVIDGEYFFLNKVKPFKNLKS